MKQVAVRLGRLHVVAVHFPIALLIAALVAESWFTWQGNRAPTATVRYCLLFGAVTAVISAVLGWSLSGDMTGGTMSPTLDWHRWFGIATAASAVGTALLCECEERRGMRTAWFRAWLVLTAVLVTVTGHLGGVLVHGDFLLWG